MSGPLLAATQGFRSALEDFDLEDYLGKGIDPRELGRRAALFAVAGQIWTNHLGPLLSGTRVQELLGLKSRQAAFDRVRRGRLLAMKDREGNLVYPAFQFGPDGRPYKELPAVLEQLQAAHLTPYTVASWFKTVQPLLGGATPISWLESHRDPSLLIEAARRTAARMGS